MRETVEARHPDPAKQGVSVDAGKYRTVRVAIEGVLHETGPLRYSALVEKVKERIADSFDGSVPWYTITVKLDLEARGVVERVPGERPQVVRLVQN